MYSEYVAQTEHHYRTERFQREAARDRLAQMADRTQHGGRSRWDRANRLIHRLAGRDVNKSAAVSRAA